MIPVAGKKLGAATPSFGIEVETTPAANNNSNSNNNNANNNKSSNNNSDTMNPMQTSDKGLVQRQRDIIKLQDEMLDEISHGMDTLHQQAVTIGEEAKIHKNILDQLDTQVDRAADGLRAEAKHADNVRIKSNTCAMYICVLLEVIVIIILLIVWFTKPTI